MALTEANLRVFSGKPGHALEAEAFIPYTWAPGSHPTLFHYNNDTYIVVTVAVDADHDNQRGRRRPAGDLDLAHRHTATARSTGRCSTTT